MFNKDINNSHWVIFANKVVHEFWKERGLMPRLTRNIVRHARISMIMLTNLMILDLALKLDR